MEEAMKKTEEELKNLKLQRIRLLKEQRAEASKFTTFKQKHEREMQQMKTKLQKREIDVARQKRIDEQRFAVLQQRLAESNRANKALKELNAKRATRKDSSTDPATLQSVIEEELEVEAASQRCQNLCKELRRQRGEIQGQIDQLEEQQFSSGKRRRLNDDPDVSIVMEGEEEFEEARQKKLAELRSSLDDINAEIKDLLKNSTISDDEKASKSSKWAKLPADIRPVFEMMFAQALTHVKKSVDLEFSSNKQINDFKSKLETKKKQEDKKKKDDEEMKQKYRQLTENLEEAKAGVHQHISFILGLIKQEKVDEAALARFEALRNQYCDVEQKIKKARRRTTHAVGLTPKPELKRNERARRAVVQYGNVVCSADLTLGDSVSESRRHKRSSIDVNKQSDEFVKRKVAMSPIRFDDETRLSEGDENESLEGTRILGTTFVKDANTPTTSQQNGTFVIAPLEEEEDDEIKSSMVTKRRSRRTDLGPVN
ncbi:unnamed protein product [Caenorhabditis angaria]|uniref:Uncharacterized protein n=1 Tax=Caenorhabditis angaria TaxID=860376 RepID=A0A9P1MWX8_9PELO|nr:unnamed protein product [Caenorhabditis angaria]